MTALSSATATSDAGSLVVTWTLDSALPTEGTLVLTAEFGPHAVGAKFLNGNKIAQYVANDGSTLAVAGTVDASGSSVTATYPLGSLNGLDASAKGKATATAAGSTTTATLA